MAGGREVIAGGLLVLAVAIVFGQTVQHQFVNYDDEKYVYCNPQVLAGISKEGVVWAFTATEASNWHPLTWLSHQFDCTLFGPSPRGHHLMNILIHASVAVLLLWVLNQMTGDFWSGLLCAALFALHPLRVESVAWVSERKDLLAGLFFMLTLWAYNNYARKNFSIYRYLTVLLFFSAGLLSKPMLVSLPLILFLLDYWPLGRWDMISPGKNGVSGGKAALIIEKIPLIFLSAASCLVTLMVQAEALANSSKIPFGYRLGNAFVSYLAYIGSFFYPAGLAVLYPHPGTTLSIWKITMAILAVTAITIAAVGLRRKLPWFTVGWLWYLIMLLPVIGLIQVGHQAMAD